MNARIFCLFLETTLLESRITLLEMNGERFKLLSSDKNEIDAMFIDGRNKSRNGDILVITCEGNCGFYEIGIVSTPLKKGYSVLGWNHPGFGGSTVSIYFVLLPYRPSIHYFSSFDFCRANHFRCKNRRLSIA